MKALALTLGRLSTLALWIAGIGLVLMTAFTGWQVYARYILNDTPSWTEPASILMMGWFIFLGAAVGVREGYHLGFDILVISLPPGAQKALMTISDLAVLSFGLGMVWYGGQLMAGTWNAIMPALGLPVGLSYLPIPTGGVLIALFTLERIARRFSGLETPKHDIIETVA